MNRCLGRVDNPRGERNVVRMNTTSTRQVSIDQLSEGDVVLAINGKDRPFPYTVTRVINTDVTPRRGKAYRMTQVRYAHGGIIPPCDPTTAVATVAV